MFLGSRTRKENGKEHRSWSLMKPSAAPAAKSSIATCSIWARSNQQNADWQKTLEEEDKRKFGYSRDKRADYVQMIIGRNRGTISCTATWPSAAGPTWEFHLQMLQSEVALARYTSRKRIKNLLKALKLTLPKNNLEITTTQIEKLVVYAELRNA